MPMISTIATRLSKFTLLFILLAAILTRLLWLDTLPPGLQVDEANAGYNAFLLMNSHRNLLGDVRPLHIDSFGDYRPALISYLTIPFIATLGLNVVSTRLPVAIFGIGLVILAYFFTKECFSNKSVALLAAALTAFSPLGILFSRGTSEAVIDVFWLTLASLTLIIAVKKQKIRLLCLVYLLLLAGYFTYFISRVLVFPLILATGILAIRQFHPQRRFAFLTFAPLVVYLVFPWGYFLRTPIGLGRIQQVSVFSNANIQPKIDEQIREEGATANTLVTRIFNNKIVAYTYDFTNRYLTFFSPSLELFDLQHPSRYFVQGIGAIEVVEFLGFVLAISYLIDRGWKKAEPLTLLPIIIFFLAPLPAALATEDFPNFLRAATFVPFWQIVAASGLVAFLSTLKKNKFKTAIILFLVGLSVWQFVYFFHQYAIHSPKHYASIDTRATEMKALAIYLLEKHKQGLLVSLSQYDGPYIYYLFYNSINIFDTHVIKPGRYFTGSYSLDNMDFDQYPCVPLDSLLAKKYDIVIMRNKCPNPSWATKVADFFNSDGSIAARAYDLRRSVPYQSYFQLVVSEKLPQTDPKVLQDVEDLTHGMVDKGTG